MYGQGGEGCTYTCPLYTYQFLKYYCKFFRQFQLCKNCKRLRVANVSEVKESFEVLGSALSLS